MTFNSDYLGAVRRLREAYGAVCRTLPWLDMSVWQDDPPAFPECARDFPVPFVKPAFISPGMKRLLTNLKAEKGVNLLRYSPSSGPLEGLAELFPEMAEQKVPLTVLHTDVDLEDLEVIAKKHPSTTFIVESGPAKILYSFRRLEQLLLRRRNVFLCTYNFCNWLGIERFCRKGLSGQLLFGTHRPRYNPHAAMGPVAMGRLAWDEKCAVAGNNLRRLIGMPAKTPPEIVFQAPEPFIVDGHGHTGPAERFPVADEEFGPEGWRAFLDSCAVERLLVCPAQSLADCRNDPEELSRPLREHMPGRIFYFAVFSPLEKEGCAVDRLVSLLRDPVCAGIKIHPSLHGVEADAPSYDAVYQIAERYHMPIVTHSWDVSPANPAQRLSHPDRFRAHLKKRPGTAFVLGHAGGRPGAMEPVVNLCRDFPGVRVDISGDYYDNGLLEKLAKSIGVERIIFGSDINWIDPRANLAPVLAAEIPDEDVLKILRTNALQTYKKAGG